MDDNYQHSNEVFFLCILILPIIYNCWHIILLHFFLGEYFFNALGCLGAVKATFE